MNDFLFITYLIVFVLIVSLVLVKYTFHSTHKVFIIAGLFFLASAFYFRLDTLRGYPTFQPQPIDSFVVAIEIVDPNESSNGGIYLWLYQPKELNHSILDSVFGLVIDTRIPRAYAIEYNEENKKRMAKLKKEMNEGMLVKVAIGQKIDSEGNEEFVREFQLIDPKKIHKK